MSQYTEDIKAVLETAEKPLNIKEICQQISTRLGGERVAQNTIYQTLVKREAADLVIKTSAMPLTFWLKSRESELPDLEKVEEERETQTDRKKRDFGERDLHPLLVSFAAQNFGLICKTIFHEKSAKNKSGKNRWIHPDIVGVNFPQLDRELKSETRRFFSKLNRNLHKIYSFELKCSIEIGTLKEYYFQAVSNSTWANEGYLVVFEDIDDEILAELERLHESFGIGVIQLGKKISETKVLLPAKQRELDSRTLNLLIEKNPNFKEFINDITQKVDATLGESDSVIKADEILDDDALENYIQKMHIDK